MLDSRSNAAARFAAALGLCFGLLAPAVSQTPTEDSRPDVKKKLAEAAAKNYRATTPKLVWEEKKVKVEVIRPYHFGFAGPKYLKYTHTRVSKWVGGVPFGKPPREFDGPPAPDRKPTPLVIAKFDYEILPPAGNQPTRVRLQFVTDRGEPFAFTVPAAVITPMTLAGATDDRVMFTLTAGDESNTAAIHPALDGSPLLFRLAAADTWAESDDRREPGLTAAIKAVNGRVWLYGQLAEHARKPLGKKALSDFRSVYTAVRDRDATWTEHAAEDGEQPERGGLPSAREIRKAFRAMMLRTCGDPAFVDLIEKSLAKEIEEGEEGEAADELLAAVRRGQTAGRFAKLSFIPGTILLSMVEEKDWSLTPAGLTSPDVLRSPQTSALGFAHRIVYPDVSDWTDDEARARFAEFPYSAELTHSVLATLHPAEREMLQDLNDAVIVHRIVWCAGTGCITGFPVEKWAELVEKLSPLHQQHEGTKLLTATAKAMRWNRSAAEVLKLRNDEDQPWLSDPEVGPIMPGIPAVFRFK